MKKLAVVISILIVNSANVFASFGKDDAGTTICQFLEMGAGARAAGIGGANAGLVDDSTAVYWNPAALINVKQKTASFMHAVWFEDISYNWLSYAHPLRAGAGVLGFGLQYLSGGSVKGMDDYGFETGTINPSDLSLSMSYGYRMEERFYTGISGKYISSKLQNSAVAFACDLGIMKKLLQDDKLSLGVVLQNIGTTMKYRNVEESLPFNLKMGSSYLIMPGWLIAFDVNAPINNAMYYGGGTEYWKELSYDLSGCVRAGYNTINKDTGGLNSVTFGFGLKYLSYGFDYAFVPYGVLGDTHKISFSYRFGEEMNGVRFSSSDFSSYPKPASPKDAPSASELPLYNPDNTGYGRNDMVLDFTPPLVKVFFSKESFVPLQNGNMDCVIVKAEAQDAGKISAWRFKVFSGNKLVYSCDGSSGNTAEFRWYGTDFDGMVLNPGDYTLVAEAEDSGRNTGLAMGFVKIISAEEFK